jgi:cytosine/adenosine deaminase-related metal-dependent hydrolase
MNRPAKNSSSGRVLARQALRPLRIDAAGGADPSGVLPSPLSVLVSAAGEVLACGSPGEVDRHPEASGAARVARPGSVLLPGLVNAHTHFDLTHIGPRPHNPADGFVPWVDHIRKHRHAEPDAIMASVRRGIELAVAGGTVAVGDIAGSSRGRYFLEPWRVLRGSSLAGVSFVECFGLGPTQPQVAARLGAFLDQHEGELAEARPGPMRIGLQPHAPNTVSREHYRFVIAEAALRGLPLSTHLAESPEERQFVGEARGPQRTLLESLGLWDDSLLAEFGRGLHPLAHLHGVLSEAPFLAAHVNDCPDEALALLAATKTTVAYCPRASAYFGAERHFGPHRYREMLATGMPVALGTDSIVNLPESAVDAAQGGMSILHEMRFLFDRDRGDPLQLLRMATVNGAGPLGLDPASFTLRPGSTPLGILAVDVSEAANAIANPIESALRSHSCPEFVFRREYPSLPR